MRKNPGTGCRKGTKRGSGPKRDEEKPGNRRQKKERQKEREQATEKGRKQGTAEERARQKAKGFGYGLTIIVFALIVFLIIAPAIAWFSVSVQIPNVTPGIALPFTTMYAVSFRKARQLLSVIPTSM